MEKKFDVLLRAERYEELALALSQADDQEALAVLSELNDNDLLRVCSQMDEDRLASLLPQMSADEQETVVSGLRENKLADVMDNISVEKTIDIIGNLPSEVASRVAETDEIKKMISDKNFKSLKELLCNMNCVDIAEVFEDLDSEERIVAFRLLQKDTAADAFVEMSSDVQSDLIAKFSDKELKGVMDDMFIDDTVDLIEEMPASVVKRLLAQTDAQTRKYVNEILKYPQNSTGSIMTPEFVSLSQKLTVADAFDKIRVTAIDKETIYTCYITDETNHLIGVTTMKELLLARGDSSIDEIMHKNVIYAHTLDDREDTARKLSEYGFLSMPVVDDEKRLVGIVTIDDAIDVLQSENTEDISKIAATKPSDKPYLKTSVFTIFKNRLPWLLVLMVSATFTGLIINKYETRLNSISTVLMACVPMLMDTGGNAGSQSSVTIIRSLALAEVGTKDILKVLWKELRVSIMLGLCLAVACFAKLQLIDNLLFGYADYTLIRSAVVAMSMFITVVMAKLIGCTLPIIAKKIKLDPAVVASPFITTIVDALSLMVFCALSVSIL